MSRRPLIGKFTPTSTGISFSGNYLYTQVSTARMVQSYNAAYTHKSWDLNPPPSAEANLSSLLLVGENEQVQAHDTWPRGPTTRGSSQ